MIQYRTPGDYTLPTIKMLEQIRQLPDEWRQFSEHLWVSKDGHIFDCTVLRGKEIPLSEVPKGYPIGNKRKNGTRLLGINHLGLSHSSAWMVASLFVPRPEGASSRIRYIDGDFTNTSASNLEWVIPAKDWSQYERRVVHRWSHIPPEFVKVSETLYASPNGQVMTTIGKNKMRTQHGFALNGAPHFSHAGDLVRVRDVIAKAFLPAPDFAPAFVRHLNENLFDCRAENLEYVSWKPYPSSAKARMHFD